MHSREITWALYPFVRLALMFMTGVVAYRLLPGFELPFTLVFIILICFSSYKDFIQQKFDNTFTFYSGFIILLLFFCFGYLRTYVSNHDLSLKHYMHYTDKYDFGIGVIQEIPIKRNSYRTEIEIKYLCNKDTCIKVKSKALIYFKLNDFKAAKYKPGDEICFNSRLTRVGKTTNPYSFNFQDYLWNRGITHQTYLYNTNKHFLLREGQLGIVNQYAMICRAKFLKIYDKYITNPEQNSIVSAMILGYRNMISDDMYKAFSDTGAVHILAVSGMHLNLIVIALIWIFDKIRFKRIWLKQAIMISCLWFFTFVTGAAPAIVRAAIMLSFILYARESKTYNNIYNILAFCCIAMLVYDPLLLYQASFQFSFAALLSLVYFNKDFSIFWAPKNKLISTLWNYISAALAAQVLVIPLTIYFFHKFPTYFVLSGIVPVIISNFILYIGILMVMFEITGLSIVNIILAPILKFALYLFIQSIKWIKALPFSSLDDLTLSSFEFFLAIILLILIMFYVYNRQFRFLKYSFLTFGLFLSSLIYRIHQANHQSIVTIYDINKSGQVDFIDGRDVYVLKFDTLPLIQASFIYKNNRMYHFANREILIDMKEDFIDERLKKENDIIQFKAKKFLILYNESQQCRKEVDVDYIIVMNNFETRDCLKLHKNAELILDKSIKYNNLKKWKDFIEERKLTAKDIRETGAIILKI